MLFVPRFKEFHPQHGNGPGGHGRNRIMHRQDLETEKARKWPIEHQQGRKGNGNGNDQWNKAIAIPDGSEYRIGKGPIHERKKNIGGDKSDEDHGPRGIFGHAQIDRILIGGQGAGRDDQSLKNADAEFFPIKKSIGERPGFLVHQILFHGFILIDDGTGRAHDQFEEDHVHGRKDIRINPVQCERDKYG